MLRAVIREGTGAVEADLEPPRRCQQITAPQRAVGDHRVIHGAFIGPAHRQTHADGDRIRGKEAVARRDEDRAGTNAGDVVRLTGEHERDDGCGGGEESHHFRRGRSAVCVQITMTPQLALAEWNSRGTRELPLYTSIAATSLG